MKLILNFGREFQTAVIIILLLVSYGYNGPFFYLHFIILLGFLLFKIKDYFMYLYLDKYFILGIFILSIWIIYGLVITPYIFDKNLHLKYLFVSFYYMICSLALIDLSLKDFTRFRDIFQSVTVLWIALNLVLLILYILGYDVRLTKPIGIENINEEVPFSGFFYNRNIFSLINLLFFYIYYFIPKNTNKKTTLIVLLTLTSFILFSESIKGLIGISLIFFIKFIKRIFLSDINHIRKKSFIIITFLIILIPLLSQQLNVFNRIGKFYNEFIKDRNVEKISDSSYRRRWLLENSMSIINKHPFTGIGAQSSTYFLVDPYVQLLIKRGTIKFYRNEPRGTYSHCNYTEIALATGWPGFFLYYFPILLTFFYLMLRRKKNVFIEISIYFIVLKLFIDIGMVSYYDLLHFIILSFVLLTALKYSKSDENSISRHNS